VTLTFYLKVPLVTTPVGTGRAINKLKWDKKEGRRAAMGGSDGKLYIYDIGDIGVPRESEWDVMRSVVTAAGNANNADLNGR
jgi:dynein intermediate chain, cytosolic